MIDVEMERLLGRAPIEVDLSGVGSWLRTRRVLVTGAAGSIGAELSRQLVGLHPADICLVDRAETPLHNLQLELEGEARIVVGDCTDPVEMRHLFGRFRPHVVFHAAAYKHVPLMEANPRAAVSNNVGSTRLLADLAREFETESFVMVSTDKAVNPTNVMGASKRACELYVQSLPPEPTRFITTRFGNVLGSQGSVVPLFLKQLQDNGVLTVTHREVCRYFMLISEACRLVLLAATLGRGGEIFAFDMGEPVRIADLARRVISLYGRGHERIVFTGLRPGEKLYEEVLADKEHALDGPHPKIKVARVRPAAYEVVAPAIDSLLKTATSPTAEAGEVVEALHGLIPEYVTFS